MNLTTELEQLEQGNNLMFFVSNALTAWDTDVLPFDKADLHTVGQLLYVAWQQNQQAIDNIETHAQPGKTEQQP